MPKESIRLSPIDYDKRDFKKELTLFHKFGIALVTPLGLRVSKGGGDSLLSPSRWGDGPRRRPPPPPTHNSECAHRGRSFSPSPTRRPLTRRPPRVKCPAAGRRNSGPLGALLHEIRPSRCGKWPTSAARVADALGGRAPCPTANLFRIQDYATVKVLRKYAQRDGLSMVARDNAVHYSAVTFVACDSRFRRLGVYSQQLSSRNPIGANGAYVRGIGDRPVTRRAAEWARERSGNVEIGTGHQLNRSGPAHAHAHSFPACGRNRKCVLVPVFTTNIRKRFSEYG
ncbi:hypothetical protein EVAR_16569_1 [Eumeta japonica]|uniref:Uncharacterized protein n=1 Tax=Eumeta variegata TaxID=151549 RepID=A0A4C1U2V9_EUMVA|nr:hypothetical protein EVAR_16569_1 [Eumeta japonica]